MPIEILKREVNILTCKWTKPSGVESLFTEYGSLKVADLLIYIDNRLVGMGKVTDSQQPIYFDINLNATRTHFTIKTRLVQQAENANLSFTPLAIGGTKGIVINEEKVDVDASKEPLICEVTSKSAKIEPTFAWESVFEDGLDSTTASEILQTWRQFKPFFWDDLFLLGITVEEEGFSKETVTFDTVFSDTLFSACPCPKHHGEWTGITRGTTPKCLLNAPTITVVGPEGNALYAYSIVPVFANGKFANASPVGIVSTGPQALNNVNYLTISWNTVSGAMGYRIYRVRIGAQNFSVNAGLLDYVTSNVTSYDDYGLAALSSLSTLENPSHKYVASGTYNWSITATLDGLVYVKTGTIIIS